MSVQRPPVDVVVPTVGDTARLQTLVERLRTIRFRPDDSVTIVNNGLHDLDASELDGLPQPRIVTARAIASAYFARNVGAQHGANPWIVFLDDDVEPVPGLLDSYFEEPLGPATAVVAGGLLPGAPRSSRDLVARVSHVRGALSHEYTLKRDFEYAQTGNVLVRRDAFAQILGFTVVESGGDADLVFRLKANGWELEVRPTAAVTHHNYPTFAGLLRQRVRHGKGAAWLATEYPGFATPERWWKVVLRFPRNAALAAGALARRDTDAAILHASDPVLKLATRIGFRRSNAPAVRSRFRSR